MWPSHASRFQVEFQNLADRKIAYLFGLGGIKTSQVTDRQRIQRVTTRARDPDSIVDTYT